MNLKFSMDQFSNDRNAMSSNSPTNWDSDYMQRFDNLKPITSQVQSGDHASKRNMFSADHSEVKSTDCYNSVIQCSQETSFSGLKYIFTRKRTILTRCEINAVFIVISLPLSLSLSLSLSLPLLSLSLPRSLSHSLSLTLSLSLLYIIWTSYW